MNRYLATIVPFQNDKLDKGSLTRHLSDNYANAPQGLFGTLKISQISHNNLKKFSPSSLFTRFIKRISYIAYHLFRFNLKGILKRILCTKI